MSLRMLLLFMLVVLGASAAPALQAAPSLPAPLSTDAMALVADSALGLAFWPGHARWGAPEPLPSVCRPGSPDWHRGQNGSDGAGLVAKAWQVPHATSLDDDQHPYGPLQFWLPHALWQAVARVLWQHGDALVHPSLVPGAVQLLDALDDWGQAAVWRCSDCALGCHHAVVPLGPSWQGRRRHNLLQTSAWPEASDANVSLHADDALRLDLLVQPGNSGRVFASGVPHGPAVRSRQSPPPQKNRR